MAIRLTNKVIDDQAPPLNGAVTLWDEEVTGFGVRIYAATESNLKQGR